MAALQRRKMLEKDLEKWSATKNSIEQQVFALENANINLGQPSATRTGWTAGAGVEWAVAQSWSVFAETNHYQFGEKDVRFQGNIPLAGNPPFIVRTKENVEAIKIGVNYRL